MRHASRRFAETDIGLTTLAGSPRDQAHGLRRMFAASRQRLVPLVHNPFATFGGIGMERLCAAFAERGLHTLVVDAADTASTPQELAGIDLAACAQQLSRSVSFLAARGLPMRWLDSRGLTTGFLQALSEAAPRADVILVHAGASDLARMFAGRAPRPLLLAADRWVVGGRRSVNCWNGWEASPLPSTSCTPSPWVAATTLACMRRPSR